MNSMRHVECIDGVHFIVFALAVLRNSSSKTESLEVRVRKLKNGELFKIYHITVIQVLHTSFYFLLPFN